MFTETPAPKEKPRREQLERLVRKFDPVERDFRNRRLGSAGEQFVVELERDTTAEQEARRMTMVGAARVVLQDVIYVRHILEEEPRQVEWRLNWILAVVLLRSVGHVLNNVDGAASQEVKRVANRLHREWKGSGPEHAIFRDFIERERNSIVKEYQFTMTEGPVPLVAVIRQGDGFDIVRQALLEENIYRPVKNGPYEGEDGRTVIDGAITWWQAQLDLIDRTVHR